MNSLEKPSKAMLFSSFVLMWKRSTAIVCIFVNYILLKSAISKLLCARPSWARQAMVVVFSSFISKTHESFEPELISQNISHLNLHLCICRFIWGGGGANIVRRHSQDTSNLGPRHRQWIVELRRDASHLLTFSCLKHFLIRKNQHRIIKYFTWNWKF